MKADKPKKEHRRRWKYIWEMLRFGIWVVPMGIILTIYTFFADNLEPWWTPYAMVGWCVVSVAILGWATYWEYHNAIFEYVTPQGMAWEFEGKRYYSRPERMTRFEKIIRHNLKTSDLGISDTRISMWFETVSVRVVSSDLPLIDGQDPKGLTVLTPTFSNSRVEGEYSRDLGTTGWEILMQLFPLFGPDGDMTEAAKESWMYSKRILPLYIPEDVKHPKDPLD